MPNVAIVWGAGEYRSMPAWRIVKLELASTEGFPNGSPGRSYLLRLPLDDDSRIDESIRAELPDHATVRRFWPDEPDRSGYILRRGSGWAFSFAIDGEDDEQATPCHLEDSTFLVGEHLILHDHAAGAKPFLIVSIAYD